MDVQPLTDCISAGCQANVKVEPKLSKSKRYHASKPTTIYNNTDIDMDENIDGLDVTSTQAVYDCKDAADRLAAESSTSKRLPGRSTGDSNIPITVRTCWVDLNIAAPIIAGKTRTVVPAAAVKKKATGRKSMQKPRSQPATAVVQTLGTAKSSTICSSLPAAKPCEPARVVRGVGRKSNGGCPQRHHSTKSTRSNRPSMSEESQKRHEEKKDEKLLEKSVARPRVRKAALAAGGALSEVACQNEELEYDLHSDLPEDGDGTYNPASDSSDMGGHDETLGRRKSPKYLTCVVKLKRIRIPLARRKIQIHKI